MAKVNTRAADFVSNEPLRYINKAKMPEEALYYSARIHTIYTFYGFVWLMFFTISGLFADLRFGGIFGGSFYQQVQAFSAVSYSTGFFIFLIMWLKRISTEIAVTNRRIIYKTGFFFFDIEEIGIEEIRGDHIKQSLIGDSLGYGTVQICTEDMQDIFIQYIQNPIKFRRALERAKSSYQEIRM